MASNLIISRQNYDAVIFDLDGVITDTADTHRAAWKEVFDELLSKIHPGEFRPFSSRDYRRWVDGKPRLEGIRSFLRSRDIELPEGCESDPPGFDTVRALGAEKNRRYRRRIDDGQLDVFDDSVALVRRLADVGVRLALVSSSRNTRYVTALLELDELFDAIVDGNTLAELGLVGKPDPDLFLEAARRLEVSPRRAVIVEDAESGVSAGDAGGFGLVIGLSDDPEQRRDLLEAGADVAVDSPAAVRVTT